MKVYGKKSIWLKIGKIFRVRKFYIVSRGYVNSFNVSERMGL